MDDKFIILLIIALFFILIFTTSLKLVFKLLINSAIGICFMLVSNHILKDTGLYVTINEFTALFTGFLGVPGIICLYILKMIL